MLNRAPSAGAMLVEAILLTSTEPLALGDIADRLPDGMDVRSALRELAEAYDTRSIMLVEVAGGWCIRTRPEHSDLCRRILPRPLRLSKAALETLAVIAYFQPVTRPEIERIRGVSLAKGTIDMLVWAGLVRPGPRRQTPGNPMTFLTTDAFLRQFDLRSLDDLPGIDEMRSSGLLADPSETGVHLPDARTEAT